MSSNLDKDQALLLVQNLNSDKENGKGTDVIIKCKTGEIKVHKLVLTSGSNYFQAMFNSNLSETKTNTVNLQDYSFNAVEIVVNYLYGQGVPLQVMIQEKLTSEVLSISHLMQLEVLFNYCWTNFSRDVTKENCVEIWGLADKFDKPEKKSMVVKYVIENLEKFTGYLTTSDLKHIMTAARENRITVTVDRSTLDNAVIILLDWAKQSEENENDIAEIIDLLSDFGLSDSSVSRILKHPITTKYAALKNRITSEVVSRWAQLQEPVIQFYVFEACENEGRDAPRVESYTYHIRTKKWLSRGGKRLVFSPIESEWYAAISGDNESFYFWTDEEGSRNVLCSVSKEWLRVVGYTGFVSSYASNDKDIFFKTSSRTMTKFNFELRDWSTIKLHGCHDCGQLLLAADNEFFFSSISENSLNIFNRGLKSWRKVVKPYHNLLSMKYKCKAGSVFNTLFFMKRGDECDRFVCYDSKENGWSEIEIPPEYKHSYPIAMICEKQLVFVITKLNLFLSYSPEKGWAELENGYFTFEDMYDGRYNFDVNLNETDELV